MYAEEPQIGLDGQKYALDGSTKISPAQGMWIYDLCRAQKPANTLEIGLAYGFSTTYFLAAIAENRSGRHFAVDPFQRKYSSIGLQHVRQLGMSPHFTHIDELSFPALTHLADKALSFDVISLTAITDLTTCWWTILSLPQSVARAGHVILDDIG